MASVAIASQKDYEKDHVFKLIWADGDRVFAARSYDDCKNWIEHIQEAIDNYNISLKNNNNLS